MIWQPKHCKEGASGANTTVIASNGPSGHKELEQNTCVMDPALKSVHIWPFPGTKFLAIPQSGYHKTCYREGCVFLDSCAVCKDFQTQTAFGWRVPDMPPCPRRSSGTPYHHTSRRNRPSKNLEPQLFRTHVERSQVEPTNTFRLYEPGGW